MKLLTRPMDLHWLFMPSRSEKNKKVKTSESIKAKNLSWRHKKKNSEEEGVLKLRVTIDGNTMQYSVGERVLRKDWTGNSITKHKKDAALNSRLNQVEEDFRTLLVYMTSAGLNITSLSVVKTYKELKEKKLPPTFDNLKRIYSEIMPGQQKVRLVDLIDNYMEFRKPDWSYKTYRNFVYVKRDIVDYLKHKKEKDMKAEDFTKVNYISFFDYIKASDKKVGELRLKMYDTFIKQVYKYAIDREIVPNNNLLSYKFKIKKTQDLRHLSVEQLQKLEEFIFTSENPITLANLNIVRDLFVFTCYTGFHTIERLRLNSSAYQMINNEAWLINKRSKTGRAYSLKLHPKAQMIITKFGGIDLLPKIPNELFNYYLKQISKQVEFEISSSKIGRKTFAYLSLNIWKVPVNIVAKAMGIDPTMVAAYGEVNLKTISDAYNFDDAA